MNQELRELVLHRDMRKFEYQLVFQCAPFLVGYKISNLVVIHRCDWPKLSDLLHNSCICLRVLYADNDKLTILLYHSDMLTAHLAGREAGELLAAEGYQAFDTETVLITFIKRYRDFRRTGKDFPHELGLLLGYPVEDVRGFIRNRGKNSLYAGYWKVYENVPAKRTIFRCYEKAKEALLLMMYRGIKLAEIMEIMR